ncbi:hypothetical protein pb186bvf_020756 [Paramecium bursaria]
MNENYDESCALDHVGTSYEQYHLNNIKGFGQYISENIVSVFMPIYHSSIILFIYFILGKLFKIAVLTLLQYSYSFMLNQILLDSYFIAIILTLMYQESKFIMSIKKILINGKQQNYEKVNNQITNFL